MLTQQQVGRFEIRDWIGRGAMGDVHLAWDPERKLIAVMRDGNDANLVDLGLAEPFRERGSLARGISIAALMTSTGSPSSRAASSATPMVRARH